MCGIMGNMKKGVCHICCADCGLKLVHALEKENYCTLSDVTLLFDNPNIHPENEFRARQKAVVDIFADFPGTLVVANWEPERYFSKIRQKQELLRGKFDVWKREDRCPVCWTVRLSAAFAYAKDHECSFVTTTLVTSQYQDTNTVRAIGEALARETGIEFIVPKGIDQCEVTKGFYKQNYCGCVFSLAERLAQKHGISLGKGI